MNKFTLILDSSQIDTYFSCPEKWNLSQYKKLVPVSFPQEDQEAMNAGTYGHKLLDIYYRAKASSTPPLTLNSIIEKCFAYDPDTDTCECGCAADLHHELILRGTKEEVIQECTRCHTCLKFRPRPLALSTENRILVQNAFRNYVFKYQVNDFEIEHEGQVEIGFSEAIYEDVENLFVLEGRIDLLPKWQGLECVVDHKFQMKTHWLYPNSIQFKNYALIAKKTMFVINYVRLVKNMTQYTLYRDVINFGVPQLLSWKDKLKGIYFDIKKQIQSGAFERHWDACKGYKQTYDKDKPNYCWFGQLCEEPDPLIQQRKEQQLYTIKKEIWRPW